MTEPHSAETAGKDDGDLDSVRQLVLQKARELRLSLADLSRKVGRNEAYMHQFMYRGSPKKLPEEARRILAAVLDLDETSLRGDGAVVNVPAAAMAPPVWRTRDVPVIGLGDPVNAAPVEWVERPPSLAAVAGAFAVWVGEATGRLRPGDLAYIHPAQPPRAGDVVAIVEAGRLSRLGELALRDGEDVIVCADGGRRLDGATMRLHKVVHVVLA